MWGWFRRQLKSTWLETLSGKATVLGALLIFVLIRIWGDFPFIATTSLLVYAVLLRAISWIGRAWFRDQHSTPASEDDD